MDSAVKDILDYVDQYRGKILETLSELVAYQSINPCDEEGIAAQDYIATRLKSLGFLVRNFESPPGIPNIVGVFESTRANRSVLLTGHVDVISAKKEEWETPPFEAVISGERMLGRGTSDMKGSLACFLIALEAVKKISPDRMGRITLASVFGEEIGQSGSRFFKEHGITADFAILGEPSRACSLHASIGLMSLSIILKDTDRLHMGARRNFIHAGGGLIGGNCIEKMATHILPGLRELERTWGVIKVQPYIPPGQALISPMRIQGGGERGFNPSCCELGVDIMYLPNENEKDVKREIESHLQAVAECDLWLKNHPPVYEWSLPSYLPAPLPLEHWGVKYLCGAYEAVTGSKMSLGGRGAITDAGWLAQQGIPTVVYGPGDIATAHGKNEYVWLNDLLVFTKAVAVFIYQSANGGSL